MICTLPRAGTPGLLVSLNPILCSHITAVGHPVIYTQNQSPTLTDVVEVGRYGMRF